MVKKMILISAMLLSFGHAASAQDDCPKICEENGRKALEACKANHKEPGSCPTDDGHIADHCKVICADLSGKSPEELQKMLPPDYKDMLEGR
jgi:hypothetical protein